MSAREKREEILGRVRRGEDVDNGGRALGGGKWSDLFDQA